MNCSHVRISMRSLLIINRIVRDFPLLHGLKICRQGQALACKYAIVGEPFQGTPCVLHPANGAQPLSLQLWDGGLLPDGLVYQFVTVDTNYKA